MAATNLHSRLCSSKALWAAWKQVKSGASAGGIDKITIAEFEPIAAKEIQSLQSELLNGNYIPQPYKKISIKKSNNDYRHLGMLCIRDKIVQQGMLNLLYPILDKQYSSNCYAYRDEKGAIKAVNRVRHAINTEKNQWMISSDIVKYFDNISHKILFEMLKMYIADKKMLDLIALCIKMGRINISNKWESNEIGLPQGSIIAPILANLFLIPLDNEILKNKWSYIRYADDFVVLARTSIEADQAGKIIKKIVCSKLNLKLKSEPVAIHIDTGFVFLGILFKEQNIYLHEAKKERLEQKIILACNNQTDEWIQLLYKTITGIKAFYGQIFTNDDLIFLDKLILETAAPKLIEQAKVKTKKELHKILQKLSFVTDTFQRDKEKLIAQSVEKFFTEQKQNKTKKQVVSTEKLINKRKKEYRKLESQGMELIVNTYGTFIGKTKEMITIKSKDVKTQYIPLSNLQHITILTNGVSLSSEIIYFCSTNLIPISFFTRSGQHYATIYNPFNTDAKLWKQQIDMQHTIQSVEIARAIVDCKIRNQTNLIKYFYKYHKKTDKGFAKLYLNKIEEINKIRKEIKQKNNVDMDQYRGVLMSIEGRAAAIYWELVAELIDDDSDFKTRERQGAKDMVNSLLNYGYAIVYARIWESILKAKLNPYVSYLHVSGNNKPTLAFDLIEPFRQQSVDRVVISMLQKKEKFAIINDYLDEESRAKLSANIYERLNRYELYRGEQVRLSEIIKQQAVDLARYISGEAKKYKPYIAKW